MKLSPVLCCLLATLAAAAADRPKIGVALGGGGARGAAHVGVLEWLEEHHIPVDYVAGTSMGGLIGGLYCAGRTPAQLREMARTLDWDFLVGDEVPYEDLDYRRKEDARDYPSGLEVGLRGGVKLPIGLVDGHAISLLLSGLAADAGPLASFDDLMIPFRCVACDMERGEQVILRDGSLAEALRATMSIPGIFAPVTVDGRVLADGGLLNNVPCDVVRAMGADIVIAVDVGTPLAGRRALESLTGIIGQSISIVVLENVRRSLREADIVLAPELSGYGAFDLQAAETIANAGYAHAEEKARLLAGLALDAAAWAEYQAAREARRPAGGFTPQFIDVTGVERGAMQPFREAIREHVGEPLRPDELAASLNSVYGSGLYSRFTYAPELRAGATGLQVRVTEKTHGPPFLYTGLEFGGRGFDAPEFLARARLTGIARNGAEWRADLALGSRQELTGEYLTPIGGGWQYGPRAFARRDTSDLFDAGRRVAEYRVDELGFGVDLVRYFGDSDELRVGGEWYHANGDIRVGAAILPNVSDDVGRLRVRYRHDSVDSNQVPTSGWRLHLAGDLSFVGLGADRDLTQLFGGLDWFTPTARGTWLAGVSGGTSLSRPVPPRAQYTLGGLTRLSAYRHDEFRGSNYLLGRLGYLHRVSRLPNLLGGGVYLGGWAEVGGVFETIDTATYRGSLSLGAVAETLIGPAWLGYSVGEGGSNAVGFSIGRAF